MGRNQQLHCIGLGGVWGWIACAIARSPHLVDGYEIHLWDKDKVETNNLDRQFFRSGDVGRSKARAFGKAIPNSVVHDEWFTEKSEVATGSLILVCADNNSARLSALNVADATGSTVIIGANETIDAEGYIYFPEWKDTHKDPRKYYPTLLEFDPFDPTKLHCNSAEALEYTPQLAIANMLAGSYVMFLWNLWLKEVPRMPVEAVESTMYKVNNTFGKVFITKDSIKAFV